MSIWTVPKLIETLTLHLNAACITLGRDGVAAQEDRMSRPAGGTLP